MSAAEKDIAFQAPVEWAIARELARKCKGSVSPNGLGRDGHKDFVLHWPVGVEVKCDYKAKETGNVYLETFNSYRKQPSGLTATKALIWAHYIPGHAKFYTFKPKEMVAWLDGGGTAGVRRVEKCGDNNSDGYLVPLKIFATLGFVKEHELMI